MCRFNYILCNLTININCDRIFIGDLNMKKIYAFTLDSDDYPSDRFRYNLRLIAFLLHDLIYNYDGEGFTPLIINKSIGFNNIYPGNGRNEYSLEYDNSDLKYTNYEPFLIGDKSFGLTLNDKYINNETICNLMNEVLLLVKTNYSYNIKTICYDSKDFEDESNRKKAMHQLFNTVEKVKDEKNKLVRKKEFNFVSLKRKIGLL